MYGTNSVSIIILLSGKYIQVGDTIQLHIFANFLTTYVTQTCMYIIQFDVIVRSTKLMLLIITQRRLDTVIYVYRLYCTVTENNRH